MRISLVIAAAAAALLAGTAAVVVLKPWQDRPSQASGVEVGGPFHLKDQDGRPVDERVLKGKGSAVFFGFTYCPEACPTTLLALGQAQDLLGPKARDFQTVFISVDPGRDTPAVVKAYLNNPAFPKATLGLTGDASQVDSVARSYHVFYEKAGDGADYTVNHSTMTYLMNPKGQFACVLPYGLTPEQAADRIGRAMRAGPDARNC
jgi:protein SCO1/2